MIEIINGDILDSEKDIIVQQVNCQGFMGAGLAKSIYQKYPVVREEYLKLFEKIKADLPEFDKSDLLGKTQFVATEDGKTIVNIFGQNGIRKNRNDKKVYTDESALLKGIKKVKIIAKSADMSVAIPTYIGCGLANGDWSSIKPEIEDIFKGSGVDVKFYHHR